MKVTPILKKAAQFAASAHEGQVRKYSGAPYITHPAAVADMVERYGGDENMIVAAFLHDTVEDCGVSLSEIYQIFGEDVGDLVADLTDVYNPLSPTAADEMELPHWGNRKLRKRLEARRIGLMPIRSQIIKMCDIMHNTADIVKNGEEGYVRMYLAEKQAIFDLVRNGFVHSRQPNRVLTSVLHDVRMQLIECNRILNKNPD